MRYDRAEGLYRFTPVMVPISVGAPTFGAFDPFGAGRYLMVHPRGAGAADLTFITAEFDPAAGRLTFSAPLFDADHPLSDRPLFNSQSYPALGDLLGVTVYANYTPFVFRVTTSDATDFSPNVYAEAATGVDHQLRLVFLWRRSYAQRDAAHLGRNDFMYKTWTLGTQVARPSLTPGTDTVEAWDGSAFVPLTLGTDYTLNYDRGLVNMIPDGGGYPAGVWWLGSNWEGVRLRVSYNGLPDPEYYRVQGWSQALPVPLDLVGNEGALRGVPEIYPVAGGPMDTVRYWLAWTSPRPLFDLRDPAGGGGVIHSSSDVYSASLIPDYGGAPRELEANWQNVR
jgi:hypothetical protein